MNYKADHRFADLMQDKTEAVSDFAKKRSMSQQRQYLPIFAVRNEVGYNFCIEECSGSVVDLG